MDKTLYPNTTKLPSSPKFSEEFIGVLIDANEKISIGDDLIIHGGFQLPKEEADKIAYHIHNGLVTVVSIPLNIAFNPFMNHVLFEDDVEEIGWKKKGYFNINIFESLGVNNLGEYYLLVSLDHYLSNIIHVTVRD